MVERIGYAWEPPFQLLVSVTPRTPASGLFFRLVNRRSTIAVGRPVTRPPPHRSRRAELPHRALRSDALSHAASLHDTASLPRGFSVMRGRSILQCCSRSLKLCPV